MWFSREYFILDYAHQPKAAQARLLGNLSGGEGREFFSYKRN